MCLTLIAPHLLTTPHSLIGPYSLPLPPRTASLMSDPNTPPRLCSLVQSRRCAVHRLVSHVAKVSPNVSNVTVSFLYILVPNTLHLLQQNTKLCFGN
ncbi:LOW QUALITY PROTEIN: uncharacterized protein LOC111831050 [Capsella rubella]|uniref:LOW QUALITY PROTEIN: uncharacterized protein LOC111831050 n=1 Tax=Capsella rubella TaxID=81985 RepID=UPI000CD5C337|nr:LOW QUALITY PROTEIN: uncharacterized protein LOC111831050 [Capsella rubella]